MQTSGVEWIALAANVKAQAAAQFRAAALTQFA
jgi:hypothetical protein